MIQVGSWVEIIAGPYRGERGQVKGPVRLYGEPETGWQVMCSVARGLTPTGRKRSQDVMYRAVRTSDVKELRV